MCADSYAYLAVDLLGDDLGRTDLKLEALTPHVLNQNTQVQGATAGGKAGGRRLTEQGLKVGMVI
jgi:hypothetical protein